jgi:uncharacterized protein
MPNVSAFETATTRGFLHVPDGPARGGFALTHGAGGNCNARILVAVAEAFVAQAWTVLRYDLPFRRTRPFGPPTPASAAADQNGIRNALAEVRQLAAGPLIAGGLSDGGRQTTMLAAQEPALCDCLVAFSYPLHPPGKPQQLRTAHFPALRIPILFVHGTADDFGTVDELRQAATVITAAHQLSIVEKAGHDLKGGKFDLNSKVIQRLNEFLS